MRDSKSDPGQRRPGGNTRPLQLGEQIRQVISIALTDGSIKDPRIGDAMITVTDVRMSPDLRAARVFVSVFPEDDGAMQSTLKVLRAAAGALKKLLHQNLALRFTPSLEFAYDASMATGAKMEDLIREVHADELTKAPSHT